MGLYDREYYREERQSSLWGRSYSVVGALIVVNVAIFLIDALFTSGNQIHQALRLSLGDLARPWLWWRFLSYGFVHVDFFHILVNMLGLWFLGRDVEGLYGRGEFLRLYLVLLVVGGLAWAVVARLLGAEETAAVWGASAAVTGVIVLFALHFPGRTVLLFPIPIPLPAWVMGLLVVGIDVVGALRRTETPAAYSVHLAGAALALLYFGLHWNFGRLGSLFSWRSLRSRRGLRLHEPESEPEADQQAQLNEEVDQILEKISREGEASLTRRERRTLENASREYQRRRKRLGGE